MLSKSFFTLPAESLKNKKNGSEALLRHATRYHGDFNLKNTHFLLKIDHPFIFQNKKLAYPGLNSPVFLVTTATGSFANY